MFKPGEPGGPALEDVEAEAECLRECMRIMSEDMERLRLQDEPECRTDDDEAAEHQEGRTWSELEAFSGEGSIQDDVAWFVERMNERRLNKD